MLGVEKVPVQTISIDFLAELDHSRDIILFPFFVTTHGLGSRVGMAMRQNSLMRINANRCAYLHFRIYSQIFPHIHTYSGIYAHYLHHSAFGATAWPSLVERPRQRGKSFTDDWGCLLTNQWTQIKSNTNTNTITNTWGEICNIHFESVPAIEYSWYWFFLWK